MNMMQAPVAMPPLMSERRVAIIGAMLVALGPVSMALYTPAMPEIVRAFGTTEAAVKLTLSMYFAGFAIAQLFCGPLSDGFGRRPVTVAFMGIYLVASTLALFSPNVHVLIAARFLQGVGAAAGIAISRAIVRDLFTNESSARIMNLIGIILAIGPAFSPVIGGVTMELFGWHAIFVLMVAFGAVIILIATFSLQETVTRDLSRIRPMAILRSYKSLLASRSFMYPSLMLGGTVGALYTLATMLPFVLIERVGLTATQFGLSMLMQSGSYFFGSLAVRFIMPKLGSHALVPIGLGFVVLGSIAICALPLLFGPSFYTVMLPIASYAVGIAFVTPALTTAALAPFPHMAGAASSLSGFMQMGGGLLGSAVAVLIGEPILAIATVIPTMGLITVLCWLGFRKLPDAARIVRPPKDITIS
ncbi:multidrug effflux MFS transporter [Mesorhizobium australicum]|uniref:Bcr/CflA family efflux transporter n=1 Tax=Mesorhizobium australicum TaxID=536018 RepID=A0A1X7PYT7_9HYPH|nr:multidrug effflux MFS transporter [Mesorhizobium australicum]SMH56653.1 MFS transporter, DHA1 family, bicyclomycin/chloramphenicol resistance protein [Mesorhizobium australicum]